MRAALYIGADCAVTDEEVIRHLTLAYARLNLRIEDVSVKRREWMLGRELICLDGEALHQTTQGHPPLEVRHP
jgi:hypothetical protein